MSDNDYGGATIVPLRSRGELRVQFDGQTDHLPVREAHRLADALTSTAVPNSLLRIEDPESVARGLREQAARIE